MIDVTSINFNKLAGLIPVCVQDAESMQVLMLAFMNEEALQKTLDTGLLTFFSRTKQRLWTKGETSGNYLKLVNMVVDCDQDALLIYVKPMGPACHMGTMSCFPIMHPPIYWLWFLSDTIVRRLETKKENSYTNELIGKGIPRIAQKVGEEGVEVALASVTGSQQAFVNEVVDLIYHVMVLLHAKGMQLEDIAKVIVERAK